MEHNPAMKSDLEALRIDLLERIEKSETTLLREFRKWAMRIETRNKVVEVEIAGLKERVLAIEEQLGGTTSLEGGNPAP